MGVPAFYRWLSEKYPKIVMEMQEDRTVRVEGTEIPLDLTAANPNGIEVSKQALDRIGSIAQHTSRRKRNPKYRA